MSLLRLTVGHPFNAHHPAAFDPFQHQSKPLVINHALGPLGVLDCASILDPDMAGNQPVAEPLKKANADKRLVLPVVAKELRIIA